jgi:LmbE family N-acetylglucosaminyl deacetylase
MRHVYLSPHLDDAVLSCGGAIHRHAAQGEKAVAITIFAGEFEGGELSPFARVQHRYWGEPPHPMALRRAEDRAALTLLDAEARHLDCLDAVYRSGPDGQWLYAQENELWQEIHPADPVGQDGAEALAARLAALIQPEDRAIVYAPLGVGHHVDHQITHMAARRLLGLGYRLAFYEDYPYAQEPGASEAVAVNAGTGRWRVEVVPLTSEDLAAKTSALSYYRSQMYILFGGAEAMPNRVWTFAASRSPSACLAERIWWPPEA